MKQYYCTLEKRALVVDSLLRSLNHPDSKIDKKWAKEAIHRLDDLRSGKVEALSGEKVFDKIWERFEK